jgi:hypothetical protein
MSAMRHSWYTMQGKPDYAIRSAFYQALVSGSIPVMNDEQYLDHLPFADMIDYTEVGHGAEEHAVWRCRRAPVPGHRGRGRALGATSLHLPAA